MDSPDPLYHPVLSVPVVTIPGMSGDQALGAELVLRSGGQPVSEAAIGAELLVRERAGRPVLDDVEPAPLRACLRYEV
jgi:hypothetical protein